MRSDILSVRPDLARLFRRLLAAADPPCGLNMIDSNGWPADGYRWTGEESIEAAEERMRRFIARAQDEEA